MPEDGFFHAFRAMPLQRELADEIGQPRNEGLVDFQVERRLRELLAIAHEHAAFDP